MISTDARGILGRKLPVTDVTHTSMLRRIEAKVEWAVTWLLGFAIAFTVLLVALNFAGVENAPKRTYDLNESYQPDFGLVEFRVARGAGFVLDPMQAGFVDAGGYILAATPISHALSVRCNARDGKTVCFAYDEQLGVIHEPDFAAWARNGLFEKNRYLNAQPFDSALGYGFVTRQAGIGERLWLDAVGITKAPISTLIGILWWLPVWHLILGLRRRWQANGWRVSPVSGEVAVVTGMKLATVAAFFWVAWRAYSIHPYSPFFFLFVFMSAGLFVGVRGSGRRS